MYSVETFATESTNYFSPTQACIYSVQRYNESITTSGKICIPHQICVWMSTLQSKHKHVFEQIKFDQSDTKMFTLLTYNEKSFVLWIISLSVGWQQWTQFIQIFTLNWLKTSTVSSFTMLASKCRYFKTESARPVLSSPSVSMWPSSGHSHIWFLHWFWCFFLQRSTALECFQDAQVLPQHLGLSTHHLRTSQFLHYQLHQY